MEMAKTDVRRGGEVRSKQLKMGKKALEERGRRKEGEVLLAIRCRKPQ